MAVVRDRHPAVPFGGMHAVMPVGKRLTQPKIASAVVADSCGCRRHRQTPQSILGLAYLAPDIVTAILRGSQPPMLSAQTLLTAKLPIAWDQQKAMLGFA